LIIGFYQTDLRPGSSRERIERYLESKAVQFVRTAFD